MTQAIVAGRSLLTVLCRADLLMVRYCVGSACPRIGRSSAILFSWLGNGLIYALLAVLCIALAGWDAVAVVLVAAINIGLLHTFYRSIKRRTARPRPYHADPALVSLLRVLDEYSFPSGHAMSLTGALVPVVMAFPDALLGSLMLWGAMAWARVASAHHYPSDVLAGTALGVIVAYPISAYLLSAAGFLLGA